MFKILERFERGADGDSDQGLDQVGGEEGRAQEGGNGIGANRLEDLYRGLIAPENGPDGQDGNEEEDSDGEEDEEAREELVRKLEGVDLGEYTFRFPRLDCLVLAANDWFAHIPARLACIDIRRLAGPAGFIRTPPRKSPEKVCRGFAVGKRSGEVATGCRG
jgi:hypothetical protein